MITSKFNDNIRHSLQKWNKKKYPLKEVYIENIFNWKKTSIIFNSPVTVITGKNGSGKSTLINALKLLYNLQNERDEFGILSNIEDYQIILENQNDEKIVVKNKKIEHMGFNLPHLIDLSFNAKNHNFFKNSSGVDMNIYLDTLEQYDSIAIYPANLLIMRELIGKQIVSAQKIIDEENPEIEYYHIELNDGTTYDSYTMGSGEFFVNQLLWSFEKLPSNSIVLIEEMENYLHPGVQKKLIEILYEIAVRKEIQFLLTSHSPTIIEYIDEKSRTLVKTNSESIVNCINNCTEWVAKDILGEDNEVVEVLVEDQKALDLVKAIISKKNAQMLKQLSFKICGGESSIVKYITLTTKLTIISSRTIGVLDGDISFTKIISSFKVPGSEPPELLIIRYAEQNYNRIAEKLEIEEDKVKDSFSSAKTIQDHHEWVTKISCDLGVDKDNLWKIVSSMWVFNNSEIPLLSLPGSEPPEILILKCAEQNYNRIAEKLEIEEDKVKDSFSSAKTIQDHHEWVTKISCDLGVDNDYLWKTLSLIWVSDNPELVDEFYRSFSSSFGKLMC
ncbi:AAA family ATPase [Methanolobus sediminis]|uniref:AAA family ATPase n=1 Tax=Methanolobus sediminis TaxID=3072978 RepID=A0AA51YJA8_9EURY|nr:AAA family ATPase [Methanolobus sediminis]WMW25375.1 AAA family ATPase [Methanolobus sediminis]